MRQPKEIVNILISIAFLIMLLWLVWMAMSKFISLIAAVEPKVSVIVIGAILTALFGLAGVLYTQRQTKLREIDEAHRPNKVEIYSEFIEIVQRIITKDNEDSPFEKLEQDELTLFLAKFQRSMMLWSRPSVITAYAEFDTLTKTKAGPEELLPAIDELYREMRKDIGLSNEGLLKNQLVKFHLTDPESLD